MAELFNKMKDLFLGVDIDDEDEEFEDENYLENDNNIENYSRNNDKFERLNSDRNSKLSTAIPLNSYRSNSSNVIDLHKRVEVNICLPKNIEDSRTVIENTKEKIISIVNLDGVEAAMAQRIADFLSGSVDALDGNIRRLSNDMFIITPNGVDISGSINEEISQELKASGIELSWVSGGFR